MKKSKLLFNKRMQNIAFILIAIIALLMLVTNPLQGIGIIFACPLVVGSLTLEGKEEEVYRELEKGIKSEVEKCAKGYVSETHMKEAISEALKGFKINLADDDAFKKVNDILEKQGLELVALKERGNKGEPIKSLEEQIKEQLNGKTLHEAIKEANGGKLKLNLQISKAATSPMFVGNVVNPASAYIPQPEIEQGLGSAHHNALFIRQYASVSPVSTPMIVYAEKYNEQGQAEFVAEGGLKPLLSFQIRTKTANAKKIAVRAKVSEETLTDIPLFLAELKSEILYQVEKEEEAKLLNGNGTDPNPLGIIPQATVYALTTIKTANPNNYDAIYATIIQLMTLNYNANVVFVNPVDMANMVLLKATDGHYILPPFSTLEGQSISGVRVLPSNSVTIGKFLLADLSKLNIRDYIEFTIEIGWENDDFSKNLVTVIGEKRIIVYIKEFDKGAFLYGDFATIKTALAVA